MEQKEKLAICFVERTIFLQGELYAESKVHSTIDWCSSRKYYGMTETVILSVLCQIIGLKDVRHLLKCSFLAHSITSENTDSYPFSILAGTDQQDPD